MAEATATANASTDNTTLEEAPSPPGGQQYNDDANNLAAVKSNTNKTDIMNSSETDEEDSESDDEGPKDFNVVVDTGPVSMFQQSDPKKSSMAQILAQKIPDTKNHTIVNKPQINSKGPNVQKQGEAEHSVYDENMVDDDKPWLRPGADISDYFNYGFDEDTWKMYCERQRMIRAGLDPKTGKGVLPRKDDRRRRDDFHDRDREFRDRRDGYDRDRRHHNNNQPQSIGTLDPAQDLAKQAADQAMRAMQAMASAGATGAMPPMPAGMMPPMPGGMPGLPPAPHTLPGAITSHAHAQPKIKKEYNDDIRDRERRSRDDHRRDDDRRRGERYDHRDRRGPDGGGYKRRHDDRDYRDRRY